MNRVKLILYVILVLVVFDLVVLMGPDLPGLIGFDVLRYLVGSAWPDFTLRPLILLSIALYGYFLLPAVSGRYQKLVVLAIVLAAFIEVVQNLNFNQTLKITFMALGTASYYALYMFAFFHVAGSLRKTFISYLPFAIILFYGILMFLALKVGGDILLPGIVYLVVLTTMTGLSYQRLVQNNLSSSSLFAAAGATLLLVSDSFRAVAILKFNGNFLLSEFLIMALYFAGQFSIARSIEAEG